MEWITPKTDWKDGDYFNLEDYNRISDNILWLDSGEYGGLACFHGDELPPYVMSHAEIPKLKHFNSILNCAKKIAQILDIQSEIQSVNPYVANGRGFNANELNLIEQVLEQAHAEITGEGA